MNKTTLNKDLRWFFIFEKQKKADLKIKKSANLC